MRERSRTRENLRSGLALQRRVRRPVGCALCFHDRIIRCPIILSRRFCPFVSVGPKTETWLGGVCQDAGTELEAGWGLGYFTNGGYYEDTQRSNHA